MVKSETRRNAEILVKKPSPRLLSKKFPDSNKGKNKTYKDETSRPIKNALKISRSCQNYPRSTFFEEPFAIPLIVKSLCACGHYSNSLDSPEAIKMTQCLLIKIYVHSRGFLCIFTGIDMCFGQPINNDVLKLVQEEVATLVSSVEENKETWMQDHEGLKTNLQNLTQLFALDIKRLEAQHVALESGLNDLKDNQLKIKESVVENELIASSNATLIQQVRDNLEEERKGLRSQQEILEGKLVGLSKGVEKMTSKENFFTSGTIILYL